MARMKAFDVGYSEATAIGKPTPSRGRAYETDKANNEYRAGYIAGLHARYPDRLIVRCRVEPIFAAIPVQGVGMDDDGKLIPRAYIECPTCARRYERQSDGTWESDRKLVILYNPLAPDGK